MTVSTNLLWILLAPRLSRPEAAPAQRAESGPRRAAGPRSASDPAPLRVIAPRRLGNG
ncbi:MAG TPA: hypothetical protein VLC09_05945 [Polyangiaceae bacterium]|nr:hypothetical protein [Polyangiaceae bacterium]